MRKLALHSVPRSGSTWLGEIFNSHPKTNYNYQPLFSYKYKNFLNENSSLTRIDTFFENIKYTDDSFVKQVVERERGFLTRFEKSDEEAHVIYKEVRYHHILKNLLIKDPEIKVIGLIRDPRAVICSWWKSPKEFRSDLGWNIEDEWQWAPSKNLNKKEEFNGFEKWLEVAYLFHELQDQYPNRVRVINYSNLISDVERQVKDIFSFAELDYSQQTQNFLIQSTTKNHQDPYSVFKKKLKDDKWRGVLPETIQISIEERLEGTNLQQYIN